MTLAELREGLNNLRVQRDDLQNELVAKTERLKFINRSISESLSIGQMPNSVLVNEKLSLEQQDIPNAQVNLSTLHGDIGVWNDANPDLFEELAPLLDSTYPILLFPVRVELRFAEGEPVNPSFHPNESGAINKKRLRVRLYPDTSAINAHELLLTEEEIEAGKFFWIHYLKREQANSPLIEENKLTSWQTLCTYTTNSQRAAWIAMCTKPEGFDMDNMGTPIPFVNKDDVTDKNFDFPEITNKRVDTGTIQPFTRVMPDRFKIYGYNENDTLVLEETGRRIPDILRVGFNPNADDTLKTIDVDNNTNMLAFETAIKWMFDFAEAERVGMAFDILISDMFGESTIWTDGLSKLFVVGVKPSFSDTDGSKYVNELIDAHHYTSGLSILKQGTATKNTDDKHSGYSSVELDYSTSQKTEVDRKLFNVITDRKQRSDGQILAEALGLEYETLYHIFRADGNDITTAMRMNNILWEATGGYYLRNMVYSVYNDINIEETKDFFTDFVRARGALPSIRIADQPYGILPTTKFNSIEWPNQYPTTSPVRNIHGITNRFDGVYAQATNENIVGNTDNPEQAFADVMGRNAVSQQYFYRHGIGPAHIWNYLMFEEDGNNAQIWIDELKQNSLSYLANFNAATTDIPYFLQLNFNEETSPLTMPLVDVYPESDEEPLHNMSGQEINYLAWLAQSSLIDLLNMENIEPPETLLFKMTRQSLLLGYYNLACELLNLPSDERKEGEFINFDGEIFEGDGDGNGNGNNEYKDFKTRNRPSRWLVFDMNYPEGSETTMLDYLNGNDNINMIADEQGLGHKEAAYIVSVKVDLLEVCNLPTSDLVLVFKEVLDLFIYRFDSWRLSLVNERLHFLRGTLGDPANRNKGLYVGAYGWLRNIKRNNTTRSINNTLSNYDERVEEQSDNQGFILAPTVNHAATAAFLKSAYTARSSNDNPDLLSVNISSERMRKASFILDGIRNGQPIETLIGYEFEKKLIESNLHSFVYVFREKFKPQTVVPTIEGTASNLYDYTYVVNGLDLLKTYKADKSNFISNLSLQTQPTSIQVEKIETALDYSLNILDALGDLATAEGAYQIMLGNHDKSGLLSDALTNGKRPPEIDILNTPRKGTLITHRVIHTLTPFVTTENSEYNELWGDILPSLRAKTEPTLNNWLISLFPDPANFYFKVTCTNQTNEPEFYNLTLSVLKLHPIDLITEATELINIRNSITNDAISYLMHTYPQSCNQDTKYEFDFNSIPTQYPDAYAVTDLFPLINKCFELLNKTNPTKSTDFLQGISLAGNIEDTYDLDDIYFRTKWITDEFNLIRDELYNRKSILNSSDIINLQESVSNGFAKYIDRSNNSKQYWGAIQPSDNFPDGRFTAKVGVDHGYIEYDAPPIENIINQNHPFTLEAGFIFDTTLITPVCIFSTDIINLSNQENFWFILKPSGDIEFNFLGVKYFDQVTTNFALNAVNHIAISYDSQEFILCINGIEIQRAVATHNSVATYIQITQDSTFLVGLRKNQNNLTQVFNGDVFNVRIWDYSRSEQEISENKFETLYNDGGLILNLNCNDITEIAITEAQEIINQAKEFKIIAEDIGTSIINQTYRQYVNLVEIIDKLYKRIENIHSVHQVLFDQLTQPPVNPTSNQYLTYIEMCQKIVKVMLGSGFRMFPHYRIPQIAINPISDCLSEAVNEPARHLLADNIPNALTITTNEFKEKREELIDNWLSGVTPVRKNMYDYVMLKELSDLIAEETNYANWLLQPMQYPFNSNNLEGEHTFDRWLGIEVDENHKDKVIEPGKLSILINENAYFKNNVSDTVNHVGITIDTWTETIPETDEIAGLAFHYDQPQSKPPQCLLLAMHPIVGATWDTNILRDIVKETFDLAVKRGEDYRTLGHTILTKTMGPIMPQSQNNSTIGLFNNELF